MKDQSKQKETKEESKKRRDETYERARKIVREYFERLSFEQKQDYKVTTRD